MSLLETVLALGDDQIASQFDVVFRNLGSALPPELGTSIFTCRVKGFDPPQRSTDTYDVWYQGLKIGKTSVVDATDKTFTLTFRMDQGWVIFNALMKWFTLTYDEENAAAYSPDDAVRADVYILAYAGTNKTTPVRSLIYRKAKCKAVKVSEFAHDSGDPMEIEAEFIYYKHAYEPALG